MKDQQNSVEELVCQIDGNRLDQLGVDDPSGDPSQPFLAWEGLLGCSCGALYTSHSFRLELIAARPGSDLERSTK